MSFSNADDYFLQGILIDRRHYRAQNDVLAEIDFLAFDEFGYCGEN
jgi:hypothetical protein